MGREPLLTPRDQYNQTLENNVHPSDWVNPEPAGKYNLVVLNNGKYLGFVSRANVFSQYRKLLNEFSDD